MALDELCLGEGGRGGDLVYVSLCYIVTAWDRNGNGNSGRETMRIWVWRFASSEYLTLYWAAVRTRAGKTVYKLDMLSSHEGVVR